MQAVVRRKALLVSYRPENGECLPIPPSTVPDRPGLAFSGGDECCGKEYRDTLYWRGRIGHEALK
jgi:hypothetical protein